MIELTNIIKDHIYNDLYKKYGEEYVVNAGYFENESQDNCFSDTELIESLKFLCTPLPMKSEVHNNSIILINTGCYNPIHDGHIGMMDAAKSHMEDLGYHVLKGYFAPDNDSYVKTKSEKYLNINQRIKLINASIPNWIFVDPWAGVFSNKDINFTTIYRRLELYIERYIGVNIPIYYVCGSDRGEFSYTFGEKTIVIERSDNVMNVIKKEFHKDAHYVISKDSLHQSSTDIRKDWKLTPLVKRELILRVDINRIGDFQYKFSKLLSKQFISTNFNYESRQLEIFNKFNVNTISLDSLMKDTHKLDISRYYNLGGVDLIKHSNRIGSDDLESQIERIPVDTDLYLFDDDTFTGGTFRFANSLLTKHRILGNISFVKSNTDRFEVLDLRDFILGLDNGLSILTPTNERFRVPYIYPFVDPFIRASIIDPMQFSKDVWEMNFNMFQHSDATVGGSRAFDCFKYLGFDDDTKISDICKYFYISLN